MVREEVAGSTQTLKWKHVESRVDSKCLYYGRFILSLLRKGQLPDHDHHHAASSNHREPQNVLSVHHMIKSATNGANTICKHYHGMIGIKAEQI
jgi:DNA-directed RNA polymerase subunit alpha